MEIGTKKYLEQDKDFVENFCDKIWKTKKARFNAASRMKKSYYAANVSLALVTLSIVAINLMIYLPLYSQKSSIITIITIILAIFVLITNLLITHLRYEYKSDNYHACGCELNELNDKLQLYIETKVDLPQERKMELLTDYHNILKKYNLNHSTVDYYRGLIEAEQEIPTTSIVKNYLNWYLFNWTFFFILIAVLVPVISILTVAFYR